MRVIGIIHMRVNFRYQFDHQLEDGQEEGGREKNGLRRWYVRTYEK